MLCKELLIGFLVAGFASMAVPVRWWQALFLTGHGWLSSIENVVIANNVIIIGSLLAGGMLLLPANNAGISAYLSAATPDDLQGRMNSAAGFISNAASPVAPVLAGLLLESFGGRTETLAGAALVVLSTAPLLASPVIRSLGRPDSWATAATSASR